MNGVRTQAITWKDALRQPERWYHSQEARRVAESVLKHQHANGGWEKNTDMTRPPEKPPIETTIDNGATTTEILFLARVGTPECREGVLRGVDYLLKAQYPNGGWPQFYPLKRGYYTHITFNDDAMARVLGVLKEVGEGRDGFDFVDGARRKRSTEAVRRGTDCILKCQIVSRGRKTVWCQQHDEKTLSPAPARAFEPVAQCTAESAGLVRFLLRLPETTEIRESVESAVTWLKAAALKGLRWETRAGKRTLTSDPNAPPLWARMYEIDTDRPIFGDRDGKVHYTFAEISEERRNGYAWYTTGPAKLIEEEYPKWKEKGTGNRQRR